MTATTGATVSAGVVVFTAYDSIFDAVFGLPAASENAPVHTDTVIVPLDTDGVTVTVYQVALFTMNPLVVPLVTDTSAIVRSAVDSDAVIPTEMAPVRVPLAVEERVAPGGVTSSTPASVIPEATT